VVERCETRLTFDLHWPRRPQDPWLSFNSDQNSCCRL